MGKSFQLDLSGVSKELLLIIRIIKQDPILDNEWLDIDWNEFYKLAIHHRLYPLLYSSVVKNDHKKKIPHTIMRALEGNFKLNTFKMLQLTAQMESFSKLCADYNIPLIVLKGPILAEELYHELSLRTCSDLDVLIPIQKLEHMESLLLIQGFKKDDYIQTILSDWKWRHHHVTYFHKEHNLKLEVHWRLNPGPGIEPSFKELWKRKRESPFTKYPVYYLGSEDLCLFLVSHGARHGWSRLRWLLDIHYSINQKVDYEKLLVISKKHHNTHLVVQAFILSHELFGTEISLDYFKEGYLRRATKLAEQATFYLERKVNLHSEAVPIDIFRYHSRHIYSLMSFHQKILYILSILYPFPEDAQTLPLPKTFHFLYFPLRPFLWIWRKTRKLALS